MNVSLCREDARYEAGGMLLAKWRISRVSVDRLQGLEVSVLWHTEGKGDEDLHVHHFHRLSEQQLREVGLADEQSIACRLPATPLSYHGKLITIRWCLRLRLFVVGGREILSEHPFYLVAPASSGPNAASAADAPGTEHRRLPSLYRARSIGAIVDWSAAPRAVVGISRELNPITINNPGSSSSTAS